MDTPTVLPRLISTNQAARSLGIDTRTLRAALSRASLKIIKIASVHYVSQDDVMKLIAQSSVAA